MPQVKHTQTEHRQNYRLEGRVVTHYSWSVPKQSFADEDEYLTNLHTFNRAKYRAYVDLGTYPGEFTFCSYCPYRDVPHSAPSRSIIVNFPLLALIRRLR
jgi:hypothetical protein